MELKQPGLSPWLAQRLLMGYFMEGLRLPTSAQGHPEGLLGGKNFSAACPDPGPRSAHPPAPFSRQGFPSLCVVPIAGRAWGAERPPDTWDKLSGTELGAGKDRVPPTTQGRGADVARPLPVTP